jgi:hypothetical protein
MVASESRRILDTHETFAFVALNKKCVFLALIHITGVAQHRIKAITPL